MYSESDGRQVGYVDGASRLAGQRREHALEDPAVQRVDAVPVGQTEQADRIEHGRLMDRRPTVVGLDLELEPGPAGQLHLRGQTKQASRLERLDPPAVHGVAHAELFGIAPSAT